VRLVVVHGAGASATDHADLRAAVEARGAYAFGLDLPGHGQYRGTPFGDPVVWTRSHIGAGDCIWGASLGAYVGLHVAATDRRLRAVVAIASTTEAIIRERMDSWGVEVDPRFREELDRSDVFEAATRIACPVLYVHARDDGRIPLEVSERLNARTPRSELLVLGSGGHSGPAHDPAVHALALDWLEQVAGAG
jgi:pimeloyl-ACP methyl ester carboxylesterase